MKPKLTDKQKMFCKEYLVDLNATQAAIRAGYSEKTAQIIGSENLSKPLIMAEIEANMSKRAEKVEIDSEFVLNGIVQTIKKCEGDTPKLDKDGEETGEYVFKANETLKGYELLGKHLKMFTDKHEHSGPGGGPIEYTDMTEEQRKNRIKELIANRDE